MEPVRVVGVAILRDGRVLAGRRTHPRDVAGLWELPGGKCEPGEGLAEAGVREVREELGCTVRVTGRLSGVEQVRDGVTLEVLTAVLVDGDPVATEHDALAWLDAGSWGGVPWMPADVPFLAELAALVAGGPGADEGVGR